MNVRLTCYRFLADYCLTIGDVDEAHTYVQQLADEPAVDVITL